MYSDEGIAQQHDHQKIWEDYYIINHYIQNGRDIGYNYRALA